MLEHRSCAVGGATAHTRTDLELGLSIEFGLPLQMFEMSIFLCSARTSVPELVMLRKLGLSIQVEVGDLPASCEDRREGSYL